MPSSKPHRVLLGNENSNLKQRREGVDYRKSSENRKNGEHTNDTEFLINTQPPIENVEGFRHQELKSNHSISFFE